MNKHEANISRHKQNTLAASFFFMKMKINMLLGIHKGITLGVTLE